MTRLITKIKTPIRKPQIGDHADAIIFQFFDRIKNEIVVYFSEISSIECNQFSKKLYTQSKRAEPYQAKQNEAKHEI